MAIIYKADDGGWYIPLIMNVWYPFYVAGQYYVCFLYFVCLGPWAPLDPLRAQGGGGV